eukprot:CAMPEP_0119279446 /NCGR_PEP_ID=MMETSP1329-20130426/20803_1 /TAXON_ID=114041 /ORGANISM="Genus nov. species nov., Strain RCC1024" /LENGTH=377 /DNA_ID=CAMNT_0007279989 /DNA_START=70 /DNA_END=1200 /DNA_ORIENTATION=+
MRAARVFARVGTAQSRLPPPRSLLLQRARVAQPRYHLATKADESRAAAEAAEEPKADAPPADGAGDAPPPEESPSIGKRILDGWEALSARARNIDAKEAAAFAASELKLAYAELTGANQQSVLRKEVRFYSDEEQRKEAEAAAEVDEKHKQLMVVEDEDTWAKLRERLKEAPIISDILRGAGKARATLADTAAGRAAAAGRDRVNDRLEDAREFWETSQNPLVYQASSVVDAITAETDTAAATRELRRLDPGFSLERWRDGVSEELAPTFVSAFVRGDSRTLKPFLSEGLFSRLSHEIRLRKEEGLKYDDAKITDCEKMEIIAIQVADGQAPILVCQFMTQQINCIRNREGEVVEGSPSDIRAYFYVMAFQRDYDDA